MTKAYKELQRKAEFKMIIEAPDAYVAAVALSHKSFSTGRGEREQFFNLLLQLDPRQIPDLGNKLKLVMEKEFMGLTLYKDYCAARVNKATLFKLWLNCCRKSNAVTLEQMIAFAPYQEDYLRRQDRFVDEEGRTTRNMAEFMEWRK